MLYLLEFRLGPRSASSKSHRLALAARISPRARLLNLAYVQSQLQGKVTLRGQETQRRQHALILWENSDL